MDKAIKGSNEYIRRALDMACRLTSLADQGEMACRDDGCAVLYGVVRDCAYRIRGQAEQERDAHRQRGQWEENGNRT